MESFVETIFDLIIQQLKVLASVTFKEYLSLLYQQVPGYVYLSLLLLFTLASSLVFAFVGFKKGRKVVAKLLLFEYIILVFCSTVVFRIEKDVYKVNLIPFGGLFEKETLPNPATILNVAVFVPLGFLFGLTYHDKGWWKCILVGFIISICIEVLQYVFNKGFTEANDVILNMIGYVVGLGIIRCFVK